MRLQLVKNRDYAVHFNEFMISITRVVNNVGQDANYFLGLKQFHKRRITIYPKLQ